MSRRQRTKTPKQDHATKGAKNAHPGKDLWGRRPKSSLPHCSFLKRECRRKERREANKMLRKETP